MGKSSTSEEQVAVKLKAESVIPPAAAPPLSSRARWIRRLIYVAMLVLFLPTLLTVSGFLPSVLKAVHPRLAGVTRFDSAVLHWWSPVEIRGLVISDATAAVPDAVPAASVGKAVTANSADRLSADLLKAESVVTRQPLWRLAMNLGRGAEVVVQRPELNLVVRDGRTNLETTLLQVFGESDSSNTQGFPVSVEFVDGRVTLQSADDAFAGATLAGISGHFSTTGNLSELPDVALVASLGNDHRAPVGAADDRFTAESRRNGVNPRIAATLDELAADFPLQPFDDPADDAAASNSGTDTGLQNSPAISVRMKPASDDGTAGQIAVDTQWLALTELQPLIDRVLPGTRCSGNVSCRMQVRMLGSTLSDGIAGRLQVAGRDVRWSDPSWADGEFLSLDRCSMNGAVAIAEDGIVLNQLRLQSSVAEFSGSGEVQIAKSDPLLNIIKSADRTGTADSAQAVTDAEAASAGQVVLQGRVDVAELSSMLPKTLLLRPGITISEGAVRFAVKVNRDSAAAGTKFDAESLRWQAAVETTPIQAVDNGRRLNWDSPIRADAVGRCSPSSWSLDRSRLTGNFGTVTIDPIDRQQIDRGLAVAGTVNPDRLWQDVSQLLDVPRPGITSDVDIQATIATAPGRVRLADVLLKSGSLLVSSPRLVVSSQASIVDMFSGSLHVEGSGAALRTLVAPWHSADWLAPGSQVTADLLGEPDQLLHLQAQIQPPTAAFREASVYRTISSTASATAVPAPSSFVIDQATVDLQLAIDESGAAFQIHNGRVDVPGLKAIVNGLLTTPGGVLQTDLTVDADYDLDVLSRRLLQDPEQNIQLSGTGHDQFRITGAPSLLTPGDVARSQANSAGSGLTPLTASGSIAWASGRLYGLPLGPGTAVATLENGQLRTEPIHCSISTGEAHVLPLYDLTTSQLQLATGSRVENIDVTQELTREWLGYVAPLLSDAAQVHGSFSARVHRFLYDLNRPEASTIQAVLTVHSATASPGSSLASLLQAVELVQPGKSLVRDITMPAQDIAFELRDGMIVHDSAVLELAGYQLRSSGGVGLNHQIQVSLDVPLERSQGQSSGTARTVTVPVTGTIGQPQIDTAGLVQNLGAGRIQQELDKRINGQLDQQLNKLFDKIR
ncbi:MAG: hypothetical protein R3C19_15815 [Planctomycetaceae bacterium]